MKEIGLSFQLKISLKRRDVHWIENIPKVDGYGSGPVEKTVDIAVARRFKKRGMTCPRLMPGRDWLG